MFSRRRCYGPRWQGASDRIVGRAMENLEAKREAIGDLLGRVESVDGHPGFSEHKEIRLGGAADAIVGTWGSDGRVSVVAVAAVRGTRKGRHWSLEVAVDPNVRSETVERDALTSAREMIPPGEPHSLWSWRKPQVRAAEALGYREVRRLLRMEADLKHVPDGVLPPGVTIEPIEPLRDIAGIIAVNNRAFAGHREAAGMNRESLDEQMGLAWFEPDGFLVARTAGVLVGFCWTKRHPEAVGEIYLVAVDPPRGGGGLGRALVTAGFASLETRGAQTGMLWVDEAHANAVALYRSLGMEATLDNREMEEMLPDEAQPKV